MSDNKPTIDELRHEYITTNISQRDLAEKYGFSRSVINKTCMRDGWGKLRKQGAKRVSNKAITKTIDAQAAHMSSLIETTDLLGALIKKSMKNIMSEDDFDERRIATIGKAWNDYLKSNTMVRGLMTPLETAQLEMARERLNINKNKDNIDTTVEVVFSIEEGEATVEECLG